MLKDFIISFKDNMYKKARNPFLGTFVLIWVVQNWELVYTLFYFDSYLNLSGRLEVLREFATNYSGWDILHSILWSFVALTLTFLLINLSSLIVGMFEDMVSPRISKLTNKSSIVLKSKYIAKVEENRNLERQIDDLIAERERLRNRLAGSPQDNIVDNLNDFSDEIAIAIQHLKDYDYEKIFLDYTSPISDGVKKDNTSIIVLPTLVDLGLLTIHNSNSLNYYVNTTPLGIKVRKELNIIS